MLVKINGVPLRSDPEEFIYVKKSDKLRKFAIILWTSSALLTVNERTKAESFYDTMEPLTHVFQDIALGLGILSALAGFILLGVKRRWGETTIKTTAIVVAGVFLVPSILMLVGIVGTMLNDALTEAFETIRQSTDVKEVIEQ